MMNFVRCIVVMIFLAPIFSAVAAEAPAAATEAQVTQWVKDLASDDFETRTKAEKALSGAGAIAIPAVTAASKGTDPEVTDRAKRILDELSWAIRPPVTDYTAIAPANGFMLLHAPSLRNLADRCRKESALGKMYDSPGAAPLKKAIAEWVVGMTSMSEQAQGAIVNWVNDYGGIFAFNGLSVKNGERIATVFGVTHPEPAKVYDNFNELMPIFTWGENKIETERYRGIKYSFSSPSNRQSRALANKMLIQASNVETMKSIIDAMADQKAGGLNKAPEYLACVAKTGPAPLVSLYWNVEAFIADFRDRDKAESEALGLGELKQLMIALHLKDELFLEKAFFRVVGERKSLVKLLSFGSSTGAQAALCPPEALGFVSLPVKGKDLLANVTDMINSVNAGRPSPLPEWKDIEQAFGVNVPETLALVDGDAGLWVTKSAGDVLAPPDITLVLPAKDAAAATAIVAALEKMGKDIPGRTSADYKGRTVGSVAKETLGGVYGVSWCADGNRVLLASSSAALQKLVDRIDAKSPGLDAAADYKRLLAQIPAAERGAMLYVNNSEVFPWLCNSLPLLSGTLPEDKQDVFNAVPKGGAPELKTLPGTLFSLAATADGAQATAIGGVPLASLLPMTTFVGAGMRAPRARAVAVPAAPAP